MQHTQSVMKITFIIWGGEVSFYSPLPLESPCGYLMRILEAGLWGFSFDLPGWDWWGGVCVKC